MKRLFAYSLIALLPLVAQAQGSDLGDSRLRRIDDPLKLSFMVEPGKLTNEQVRQAVEIAALAKNWTTVKAEAGRIELRATKNGRHVLHVALSYDATACEIRYLDSVDLMYQDRGNSVRVIHRNYNVWIRDLADAIANRLGQPTSVSGPPAPAAVRREVDPNASFRTRAFK